jgi:hypothetical protein
VYPPETTLVAPVADAAVYVPCLRKITIPDPPFLGEVGAPPAEPPPEPPPVFAEPAPLPIVIV